MRQAGTVHVQSHAYDWETGSPIPHRMIQVRGLDTRFLRHRDPLFVPVPSDLQDLQQYVGEIRNKVKLSDEGNIASLYCASRSGEHLIGRRMVVNCWHPWKCERVANLFFGSKTIS